MGLREIMIQYGQSCYQGFNAPDQAITGIKAWVKVRENGAYKSGYHDALNNRPFKAKHYAEPSV